MDWNKFEFNGTWAEETIPDPPLTIEEIAQELEERGFQKKSASYGCLWFVFYITVLFNLMLISLCFTK